MKRVGIPRALPYYQYMPMWRAFFQELGLETVVSPPTSREMVATGMKRMVAETCLPVKVYAGHVCWLRDQGVDYVMVPAIRATEPGLFHCSKFLGLPDLMAAVVENCPPLLELNVDIGKKQRDLQSVLRTLGKTIEWKPWIVQKAVNAAWDAHLAYEAKLQQGYTIPDILTEAGDSPLFTNDGHSEEPQKQIATLALVGHPYLAYDQYITHNLVGRLRKLGVRIVTPEMAEAGGLDEGIHSLAGEKYWVCEGEVTGAAGYYMNKPEVDGIIAVVAFGCGPDSTMLDVIQRAAARQRKPLMSLVLDEHTGVAGLMTRLEAFVDMVARKSAQTPVAANKN